MEDFFPSLQRNPKNMHFMLRIEPQHINISVHGRIPLLVSHTYKLPYNRKISPSPGTFILQKYLKFHQCSRGCHILYIIINTGQKIS